MTKRKQRRGITFLELLVVLGCITLLLALVTPAISQARAAARRSHCKNNLKMIGLAMHNYHDVYGVFPPGWISESPAPDARVGYGWQTFILPQMEQSSLHRGFDFNKPLPPPNAALQTAIPTYRCPEDATPAVNPLRSNYGTSNYSGNFGTATGLAPDGPTISHWLSPRRARFWPGETGTTDRMNGIFYRNSPVRIARITDGTSNTFIVGERSARSGAGIWPGVAGNTLHNDAVTDCSPGNMLNSRYTAFSSEHGGGANFAFCDGSVHFISNTISEKTYGLLGSRNDGQPVGDF